MLRISRDETNNGSVCLRLEGELIGPWVDETRRFCEAIIDQGRRLRIDLSQVAFVDRAGVELLARLKKRKTALDRCSPLLRAQLGRCVVAGIGDPGGASGQYPSIV